VAAGSGCAGAGAGLCICCAEEKEGHRRTSQQMGRKQNRARKDGRLRDKREGLTNFKKGFRKGFKQKNSNLNLNSSKQKKRTSMNATINSYSLLILF
jgi:hypothetical protein